MSCSGDDFCLIIWAINIIVFTPRDEHSQEEEDKGEHPHNWLHQRDCTYKSMIKHLLKYLAPRRIPNE